MTSLESEIATLAEQIELARGYDFGGDLDTQWWHDAVRDLGVRLQRFFADDRYGDTRANVAWRVSYAEAIVERSITGPDAAPHWERARADITDHPDYDGLDLEPITGIVPLDVDPDSGLWEFWHVQSGERPEIDPETGRWAMTGEAGIVLVLIPGGTYQVGSQSHDESGPHFDLLAVSDETPHEVELDPFFLSKYEVTQGQWERLAGKNPSYWAETYQQVTSRAHPVDRVTWFECKRILAQTGLALPTESQWEVACRAFTETPWHFGDDILDMAEYGNIRDRAHREAFTADRTDPRKDEKFDDGHGPPARVGSYEPNDFGLHDMHGNLWEWCLDSFGLYTTPARESDGLRENPRSNERMTRGGAFNYNSGPARSAERDRAVPEMRTFYMGCRAALTVSSK